jgi:hypothetical protein
LGDSSERKAVPGGTDPLLDNSDPPFGFWDMLIGTGQVDSRASWHGLDQGLERSKFTIKTDSGNTKASLEIQLMNLLVSLEDSVNLLVGQMVDSSETNVAADGEEEWNLVHEEDISCKVDFLVKVQYSLGNFDEVLSHVLRFGPGGLALQSRDVRSPNLMGSLNISQGDRAVLDLIALDDPFEVLQGWILEFGIESSSLFSTLQLTLAVVKLVA